MRAHSLVLGGVALVGALTSLVLAQPRPQPRPNRDAGAQANDASAPSPTSTDSGTPSTTIPSGTDAGVAAARDVPWPMRQTGEGTVIHFPVPEQLARTEVPVFAQIRSTAPIDHVSLFYRAPGARRYTEARMIAMGQQFRLASGYGAQIPCDDAFPPRVEYYVEAYDSSNTPNGHAGTDLQPLQVPIVDVRHFPAPTLPGQNPPRNCGTLLGQGPGAVPGRDAGAAAPERGTADLGEPCRNNNDCRRGLRCGAARACVFEGPR